MKAHPHGHAAMHRDVECPALPTAGPRRRPHWLSAKRVRTYAIAALVCYAAFGGIYLARWLSGGLGSPLPPALDFVPAWSAAHLAVHGHALDAWRFAALHPVELQAAPSMRGMRGVLLWLYPPQTLLLVAPLGWLPYPVAALAWVVGTGALFVATVRAIVPRRLSTLCALAFPGTFLVALVGQNSLLTAALAGFGLVALRRRPALAGCCFGLLVIKPQLAPLFPLALLCASQWRALSAWAATVALVAALSTFAFGFGAWAAFAHGAASALQTIGAGQATLARIPTFFAMATFAGLPLFAARLLQAAAIAFAAGAVIYAWRGACAHALRSAALVCASLLVSPYLYDYDLAWYAILIAWAVRHAHAQGWRPLEREGLAALALMPLAGLVAVEPLGFQFLPLVTAGALAAIVVSIARERHGAPCLADDEAAADAIDSIRFMTARGAPDAAPRRARAAAWPLAGRRRRGVQGEASCGIK
ncbi:glycosyltransferase family 87 protein [Burkholderia pseudomallei]